MWTPFLHPSKMVFFSLLHFGQDENIPGHSIEEKAYWLFPVELETLGQTLEKALDKGLKFGQSPGIGLYWSPNVAKQRIQMIIFQRDFRKRGFRKCWKVFIINFVFIIDFYSCNNVYNMFSQAFYSFLNTADKNNPSGCVKKISKWSYLAVNGLIEFLNCMFYTAHQKEAIAPKFSAENLFWKKDLWQCNMERIQNKKTCMQIVQHENCAVWGKSNMRRV